MKSLFALALVINGLVGIASAASYPPKPQNLTKVESKIDSKVTISFKETTICETTDGVKSYSGYIHLPQNLTEGRSYDVNTFFWFFESRKDPQNAPLSLWLQGGPGTPSIPAALGENGPCSVQNDSTSTVLNPWSWNNEVNMLYIDQPVQVGFSYDSLINGTINELVSPFAVKPDQANSTDIPSVNNTLLAGTFASQDKAATANTTHDAALAIWHFMQTWTQEFPVYKPANDKISIWTESYGGHYGPTFANFFESQNDLISNGSLSSATPLHLDTVGIVSGCIDILTQMPLYPQMAFNNTYGLKVINHTEFEAATNSFPRCQNLTLACRSELTDKDPGEFGNSTSANNACSTAFDVCFGTMWNAYNKYDRDVFDIARRLPDPFPPKFAAGYLNSRDVQLALGVPLNFTGESSAVSDAFKATGDFVRDGNLQALGALLDRGVKVALVYGDRDYQCNWLGGEQVSLAINSSFAEGFRTSGYSKIINGNLTTGGVVRQNGNFSFSRVFEAGHQVPYYKPETAYNIFHRVMFDTDVATGKISTGIKFNYSTIGPNESFSIKDPMPRRMQHSATCYLWDMLETCTPWEKAIVMNGTAIIENFLVVGYQTPNGTAVRFADPVGMNDSFSFNNGSLPDATSNGTNSSVHHSASPPTTEGRRSVQVVATILALAMVMLAL